MEFDLLRAVVVLKRYWAAVANAPVPKGTAAKSTCTKRHTRVIQQRVCCRGEAATKKRGYRVAGRCGLPSRRPMWEEAMAPMADHAGALICSADSYVIMTMTNVPKTDWGRRQHAEDRVW